MVEFQYQNNNGSDSGGFFIAATIGWWMTQRPFRKQTAKCKGFNLFPLRFLCTFLWQVPTTMEQRAEQPNMVVGPWTSTQQKIKAVVRLMSSSCSLSGWKSRHIAIRGNANAIDFLATIKFRRKNNSREVIRVACCFPTQLLCSSVKNKISFSGKSRALMKKTTFVHTKTKHSVEKPSSMNSLFYSNFPVLYSMIQK